MKLLFALLMVSQVNNVIAQRQVASMPITFDEQSLKNGLYGIFCQENPTDRSFSCVLKNGSNISYALFSPKYELIKKIEKPVSMESPLAGKSSRIHSGMINGSGHVYICKAGDSDGWEFSMQTVDYNSGDVTDKELFALTMEDIEVAAYTYDNRFYHISVLKDTDSMTVRTVTPDGNITTDLFEVTLPSFAGQPYIPDLSAALTIGTPMLMTPENEGNFYYSNENRKIYPGKDIIRLVANWRQFHAYVITIDLNKKTAATREFYPYKEIIKPHPDGGPYLQTVINDDKVFSLFMYDNKADIAVHDLLSGNLLNLVQLPSNFDRFAATPTGFRRDEDKESMSEAKSFARTLKSFWNNPCIAVISNGKGFYEVSIGGHNQDGVAYKSNLKGGWTEKNAPRYPRIVWGTPHYMKTWHHAGRYEQVIYKVMLDAKNFQLANDQKATTAQPEKFHRLFHRLDRDIITGNSFYLNNQPAAGYYKSKEQAFVIEVLD